MDNKKLKGFQDDSKIDSTDLSELRYAAVAFGVTPGAIVVAIHTIKSNSRKKVGYWLAQNWFRIYRNSSTGFNPGHYRILPNGKLIKLKFR